MERLNSWKYMLYCIYQGHSDLHSSVVLSDSFQHRILVHLSLQHCPVFRVEFLYSLISVFSSGSSFLDPAPLVRLDGIYKIWKIINIKTYIGPLCIITNIIFWKEVKHKITYIQDSFLLENTLPICMRGTSFFLPCQSNSFGDPLFTSKNITILSVLILHQYIDIWLYFY